MKARLTDIHQHLLYGMDDGARSADEMHAMLRRAAAQGIARIVATPHITPGVERFDFEQYERARAEAQTYCAEEGLGIEMYAGAEILYTEQTCRFLEEGRAPTMAGTDHVLVEFSPDIRYEKLHEALTQLQHYGYLPIVAHVERYECLTRRPSRLGELKDELDVCFQVNCATIIQSKGFAIRHFLKKLIEWDMLDAIATDAHHAKTVRTVNMREAYQALKREYGASYARHLTDGHLLFNTEEERERSERKNA